MTERVSRLTAACLAALALAGCATTPPDQDPVQIKLNDIDARLTRIERVVANQSLLDLSNQVEALRTDVRAVHNDVDQLTHNLDAARKQQHDLYADLDQRMKALEAKGPAPASSPGAAPTAPAAVIPSAGAPSGDVADKVSYQAAFDLLRNSQYDRAITAFQSFLATYSTSPLADNAQYWLGEAYYVNRSYPESLAAFQRVVTNYPQARKLPDALLKMGFCYYELQQFSAARDVLTHVTTQFADSSAAHLAQQRLDKMASENH